ncbi:MAG: endopeptidase La [Bacteroidales bacterium]|jgi:ATP-dependent Lon protease|nr:endopeptidase La [Bacteroidales bacterium]
MSKFDEINKDVLISENTSNDNNDIFPVIDIVGNLKEDTKIPDSLPILPLRNTVLFPDVIIPIAVGREKSLKLIEDINKTSKMLGVVTQMNGDEASPTFKDLYEIGTVAVILKVLNMPDGSITAIIQGKSKFHLEELIQSEPYFVARITPIVQKTSLKKNTELNAQISTLKSLAEQVIEKSPNIPNETNFALQNIDQPKFIINYISNYLDISVEDKQKLLEMKDITDQANALMEYLTNELKVLEVKKQIEKKVKVDIDKQQRDYILNQQLKTIQEELGDNSNAQDIDDLKKKASKKKWADNVKDAFEKELGKLQRLNPMSMEYSIQKTYLDTLVDIPWNEYTEDDFDPHKAQKIIDADHYGLETVKKRIIEFISVLKLKKNMRSPIICLVGPPGVGKTSLGKSIAKAIGRKYVRMSLGGLHDESEIRGHRKTYIGAMPGRVIQSLIKAKSANPVFILDEIDKVGGMSVNGDPSAALLELLDPEQNNTFYDNYVEIEFDLSKVLFVATANSLQSVHPALRDRMEIIDISGYLIDEKREIAKRHLIPKQRQEHGVKASQVELTDDIINQIINEYTRESGVRVLEKNIATIIRNRAKQIVMEEPFSKRITKKDLVNMLGQPKFMREDALPEPTVGVVTGLAWTAVGGEILFIETSLSPGDGKFTMTGNLGDVMKESATLAFEYIKSHAKSLGIDEKIIKKHNIHIHVPEGATPKDGPSAGITIFTALVSIITNKKVKNNIAMTGEITLRGKVLPVGGIKEKILAAKRSHIDTIVLSKFNKGDIDEIKPEYIEGLNFIYIDEMRDIMNIALE